MPVMIEAQRASILVPHDHRHISHVRMLLAWIWVLASRSSKAESRRPDAYSFDYCGRKEDQRGCYGTQAYRYERGARFRSDIRSGRRWRWIETKRFRHVMPPEDLKIDGVPAEYPDDAADPPQPSHRQISGSCLCCMDLVYHGCWLVTCSSAMPDDRYRLPREGGQDERLGQPGPGDRCGLRLGGRASALVIRCPGPEVGAVRCNCFPVRGCV